MRQDHMPCARAEAQSLLKLVGKNGDTVETVRELIGVSPRIEAMLKLYAEKHQEDAAEIERSLRFRKATLEEFEHLAGHAGNLGVLGEQLRLRCDLGHSEGEEPERVEQAECRLGKTT